jgi:hypothetical protein
MAIIVHPDLIGRCPGGQGAMTGMGWVLMGWVLEAQVEAAPGVWRAELQRFREVLRG